MILTHSVDLEGRPVRPSLFMRRLRTATVVAVAAVALQACAASNVKADTRASPRAATAPPPTSSAPAPRIAAGRLRPPPTLACDDNHLTSWTGRVTGYKRGKDATWFEISTDEDTVESAMIRHEGNADASAHYLMQGAAFAPGDMARIESGPGVLKPGMRATAWVCELAGVPPRLDWQPPPE